MKDLDEMWLEHVHNISDGSTKLSLKWPLQSAWLDYVSILKFLKVHILWNSS